MILHLQGNNLTLHISIEMVPSYGCKSKYSEELSKRKDKQALLHTLGQVAEGEYGVIFKDFF